MVNIKPLLAMLVCAATTTAFAEENLKEINSWEILVSGGIATLDANSSLIQVSDIQTDKITQTNQDDWDSWTVQLGVGYIIPLSDETNTQAIQWFPSLEPQINVYYFKGDIKGDVDRFYQYAGDYSDTDYQSDFESTRLMLDVALTVAAYHRFSLFGIAGVGPSWNRIGYDTGTTNDAQLHLNKQSQTNFAYEFGGGISYAVNENLALSAEYLFTGFNNIELGDEGTEGHDREVDVDPQEFNLNTQAALLGLRFAF